MQIPEFSCMLRFLLPRSSQFIGIRLFQELIMYSVLFVCLGNICRSPSAEGMMRSRISNAGLPPGSLRIDSAGLHGFHAGEPPDSRARRAARNRGYSLDGQTARQVTREDFTEYDLILGMDSSHIKALERNMPKNGTARISLLLDFAENPSQREVPDPYYGGEEDFEYVLDLIETGVDGLVRFLCDKGHIL